MVTSEACIQKFKEEYDVRLTSRTIDLYQKAVAQLVVFSGKPYDEITSRDIRSWLMELEKSGYKPMTIHTRLAGVKLFYRYCLEEALVTDNPVASIPFPQAEEKIPHYLQLDQLNQLRKMVEGRPQERAVIEVLYATGIRISELVAMKKEDLNWSERILHIPKGKGNKARIVLFTQECAEHLTVYLQERSDDFPFVFLNSNRTRPICKRTIQLKFATYKKQMGLHLTPHTLRHTFAAHLSIKGMPLACIQLLLGHDSPHQTQLYARLYSHARKQMYDEWM